VLILKAENARPNFGWAFVVIALIKVAAGFGSVHFYKLLNRILSQCLSQQLSNFYK